MLNDVLSQNSVRNRGNVASMKRVIVQVFRAVVQNFDRDSAGPGLSDRSAARSGLMGQNGASVALHQMKAI